MRLMQPMALSSRRCFPPAASMSRRGALQQRVTHCAQSQPKRELVRYLQQGAYRERCLRATVSASRFHRFDRSMDHQQFERWPRRAHRCTWLKLQTVLSRTPQRCQHQRTRVETSLYIPLQRMMVNAFSLRPRRGVWNSVYLCRHSVQTSPAQVGPLWGRCLFTAVASVTSSVWANTCLSDGSQRFLLLCQGCQSTPSLVEACTPCVSQRTERFTLGVVGTMAPSGDVVPMANHVRPSFLDM